MTIEELLANMRSSSAPVIWALMDSKVFKADLIRELPAAYRMRSWRYIKDVGGFTMLVRRGDPE